MADTDSQKDDPQLVPRLVAHMVARVADRFPFARKLSRHFEGQDRRAGFLSDLVAALVALYKRNPETCETLARQAGQEFQRKQAERRAANQARRNGRPKRSQPKPEGVTHAQA